MNEENHSEEERLIVKCLTGEATAAEEKSLQEWIVLSKENEQAFNDVKKSYELSGKHYSPKNYETLNVNVDQEWDRFLQTVDKQTGGQAVKFIPEQPQRNAWLRIAAVILLVIVSGIVINYFVLRPGDYVYETAQNTETVTLPDGSVVFLNRNSKLSYAKTFGEENRKVSLAGEGFFEVVPNADSPFVVKVDKAEITVLGTSFNVQGYDDRDNIEVIVETGIVKLASTEIKEIIKLKAGERGIFVRQKKELIHSKNDDVNYLSWKTRRIEFDGSSLSSVVEVLKSTYGIDIVVSASVPDTCEVTVTFEDQPLEAVFNVLKSTLNLTYKREGNKIEITQAGC